MPRTVTRYGRAENTGFAFTRKRFGVPTDLALGTRRARAAALLTLALPGRDGSRALCVVNFGSRDMELPEHRELLLASGPLAPGGALPQDAAVWLRA